MIDDEFILKVILLGNSRVGKTSLRKRYMGKNFGSQYRQTLGVDLSFFSYKYRDVQNKIVIWDLAGEEVFKSHRYMYFKGALGAFLVLDLTQSLDLKKQVDSWVDDLELNVGNLEEFSLAIIFNKLDLVDSRQIMKPQEDEVLSYVRSMLPAYSYAVFETSALNGDGVKDAFEWIITRAIESALKTEL